MKKDVIYIDIEDDITAIIDKLKKSKSKIVALVPPKHSIVLSSAVNLRLLQKAAQDAKKRFVLVTNETVVRNLAGRIGVPVANNLHSKPHIPKVEPIAATPGTIDGAELDPEITVGELSDLNQAAKVAKEGEDVERADERKAKKALPKFKIPSFERFRVRLFLALFIVAAITMTWWWAFKIAPKASITVSARTQSVSFETELLADGSLESDNFEKNQFKAIVIRLKRTVTEAIVPTGEKNVGDKAKGTITAENCNKSLPITVPAGTVFTADNGLNFVTDADVTVPGGIFDLSGCTAPGTADVNVTAAKPGDIYNLAPTSYSTATDGLTGSGGQMSGGTDAIVNVVAQADLDKAAETLKNTDRSSVMSELHDMFGADAVPIDETFTYKIGKITSDPKVGEEANQAVASAEVTFTMLGLPRETLNQVLDGILVARAGSQVIYRNGIDDLVFALEDKQSDTKMVVKLFATGYVGPELDEAELLQEIEGKSYSEAVKIIKSKPGVTKVDLVLEPFWVIKVPSPDKVALDIKIDDSAVDGQP